MNMKKYLFPGVLLLSAALLMLSGCPQPPRLDDNPSPEEKPPEEDLPPDSDPAPVAPELIGLTINSTAPEVNVQIIAAPRYRAKAGSVTWQWTADDVLIEGATSSAYTPVAEDFNKILGVTATPAGTTKGEPKTQIINARVVNNSASYPARNNRYSVKDLFATEAGYYFNAGSNIYEISEDAYSTIKLIFDINKDNGAIQFFRFPFKTGGELDLDNDLAAPSKKIQVIIDPSLTGTRDNPLIVTIPFIPSAYEAFDQLLYYKNPVYLIESDSGTSANAKYVNIVIEDGGYLYIGNASATNKQKFKGLIRAKKGAVVVDDGATLGYSAGDEAFYWFDYGSYCWVRSPTATPVPFIVTEDFSYGETDKPGIVWDSDRPNSFIWVGDNTFLLQGKVTQVQTFSLSADLKLTPGSEYIIGSGPGGGDIYLLLEGKNIVKWLPNPQEDYYSDLILGGAILPEPRIHVEEGSAIIDYVNPGGDPPSLVANICTPAGDLGSLPEKLWIWNSRANTSIPVGNKVINGGWQAP
jgi:hypothetical protein